MDFDIKLFQNEECRIPFRLRVSQNDHKVRLEFRDQNSNLFFSDILSSFKHIEMSVENQNIIEMDGTINRKIEFNDHSGLTNFIAFISTVVLINPITALSFDIAPRKVEDQKDARIYLPNDSLKFNENQRFIFEFMKENDEEFMWHKSIPITESDINNIMLTNASYIPFSLFDMDAVTYQKLFIKGILKSDMQYCEEQYLKIKKFWSTITKFQWQNNHYLQNYVKEIEKLLQQSNTRSQIIKTIIFEVLMSCMYLI